MIDHRDQEGDIIEAIAALLVESLESRWENGEFLVVIDNQKYKLPLTQTRHDPYVVISSVAEILGQNILSGWM